MVELCRDWGAAFSGNEEETLAKECGLSVKDDAIMGSSARSSHER